MAKWIFAAFLLVTSATRVAGILSCGDTVSSHATVVLADDLTCDQSPAILLEPEGRLDLNGRTIALRGGGAAIECIGGGCAIFNSTPGPAAIVLEPLGEEAYGVRAVGVDPSLPELSVQNVGITGGRNGIHAPEASVFVAAITVAEATDSGIVADDLRGFNVTAIGNGRAGVWAHAVSIDCGTILANGSADVVSTDSLPRLGRHVTCDTSADRLGDGGHSWNVCAAER